MSAKSKSNSNDNVVNFVNEDEEYDITLFNDDDVMINIKKYGDYLNYIIKHNSIEGISPNLKNIKYNDILNFLDKNKNILSYTEQTADTNKEKLYKIILKLNIKKNYYNK